MAVQRSNFTQLTYKLSPPTETGAAAEGVLAQADMASLPYNPVSGLESLYLMCLLKVFLQGMTDLGSGGVQVSVILLSTVQGCI